MGNKQEIKRIEKAENCLKRIKSICQSNKERKNEKIQHEVDYYFQQKENESFPAPIFNCPVSCTAKFELITNAVQVKKEVDWEWDRITYATFYSYSGKEYKSWSEMFKDNLQEFLCLYNAFCRRFLSDECLHNTFKKNGFISGRDLYWFSNLKSYIDSGKLLSLKQIKTVLDIYKRYQKNG